MEKLVDVHAHLDDEQFEGEVAEIVSRAKANGVEIIITNGTNVSSSKRAVEIAERFDEVFCAVGIHPEDIDGFCMDDLKEIERLCECDKVVAIGEIGLDYHFRSDNKLEQIKVFEEQLKLAHKLALPVVIHCRDAVGDMLETLKRNKDLLSFGALMHCFSESVEVYHEIQKLGLYISVGGVLTFKNAKKIVEVARVCDKTKILLETDCPYLAPVPKRGERNEPQNVRFVAQKLAEIWGMSEDEVAKITTGNAKRLFWRNYGI